MGIFFPDNDNRRTRVVQLGTEAQDYLQEAKEDYEDFEELLKHVNEKLAVLYKEAGLKPPTITKVDIFKASEVEGHSKVVDIAKILTDLAGFAGTVKYLMPGATKFLVSTGVMAEQTAARVLAEFTIPLVGREVSITLGDVAGTIVGGALGGVAIAGLDLGIDAIEGVIARDKLRAGINQTFPLRAGTKLSQEKASTLLDSLRAVKTTLDAIIGAGIPLTEQTIENLITKDVQPSITKEQAITPESVAKHLKLTDFGNKSWTVEDPVALALA